MRTSVSHPLQIAEVAVPNSGMIGTTFCPGKQQIAAATGGWARSLDADFDRVTTWGVKAVVTLVTAVELMSLCVENLGEEVAVRGISWFLLPIEDVTIPTPMTSCG